MRVITRVFHCTRMEVADYWADDEDIKDSRHAPQHAEDLKALEVCGHLAFLPSPSYVLLTFP